MIKTFQTTKDDYSTYAKLAVARFRKDRNILGVKPGLAIWFLTVVVLLFLFRITGFSLSAIHWPTALAVALPLLIISIVSVISGESIARVFYPKKDGLIIGQKTIELDDEGISDSSNLCNSFFKWSAFDEVVNYDGNVYILLGDMRALIFPESCFTSDAEREELYTFAKDRVKSYPEEKTLKRDIAKNIIATITILLLSFIIIPWIIIATGGI